MERIVVGSDLSSRSRGAVHKAAELAGATGAIIHLVCASPSASAGSVGAVLVPAPGTASPRDRQSDVEALADELRRRRITVEVHTPMGEPSDALCQVAGTVGADLIVVGNKRMQGAARILGSVPKRVIEHADCHVLVVRTA